jgi:membrane protease YdiL (CAAX protease family)
MLKRVAVFLLLLYGWVALVSVLYLASVLPLFLTLLAASWAPNLAAFVLLGAVYRERGAVKGLLKRWIKVRVPAESYGLVAAYVLVVAAAIALYAAGGGRVAEEPDLQPLGLLMLFPMLLFTGAMGEELGWRGFLLDELQRRFSGLASALIIAPCWIVFHIPLWIRPEFGYAAIPFPAFIISNTALSITMAYLVNTSRGSLFVATLAHFLQGYALAFVPRLGIDPGSFFYYYAGMNTLYALVVIAFAGRRLERPRERMSGLRPD